MNSHPGEYLRSIRQSQEKPLRQVAIAANLSISFLSECEREKAMPSWDALNAWARALGYEVEVKLKVDRINHEHELP